MNKCLERMLDYMYMAKIYENKDFIILGDDSKRHNKPAYILYNKHKEFKDGHTHLNNFNTAKYIMELYTHRKVPLDLRSTYLLQSLIRISSDVKFTAKIEELIEVRESKSSNYYINVQKGNKRSKKGIKK